MFACLGLVFGNPHLPSTPAYCASPSSRRHDSIASWCVFTLPCDSAYSALSASRASVFRLYTRSKSPRFPAL